MTPQRIGRYVLLREVAAGGMASVVLGRMLGPGGFGKTVAIKRLHPQFAKDADFVTMFLDEARVTSGLSHPNIVLTLDVIEVPGELLLVMEYVHGAALASVMRTMKERGEPIPPRIAAAIVAGALHGLHAAHQATDETGVRLDVVHRDVSPQNILLSTDGIVKIADFGIAKAAGQVHSTSEGVMKGKFAYMAPEQPHGDRVTAKTDVFAAGIVLWELLTSERLIDGSTNAQRLQQVLTLNAPPPSSKVPGLPPAFDAIVARALEKDPNHRWLSARAMAIALENETSVATASEMATWLHTVAADFLRQREELLSEMQRVSLRTVSPSSPDFFPESGSQAAARSEARDDGVTISEVSLRDPTLDPGAASGRDGGDRQALPVRKPSRSIIVGGAFVVAAVAAAATGLMISARSPNATTPPSGAVTVAVATLPTAAELTGSVPTSTTTTTTTTTLIASATPPPASTQAARPAGTPLVGAAAAKPRPPAASASSPPGTKAGCKIQVAVDASGRTQFKEVCPP